MTCEHATGEATLAGGVPGTDTLASYTYTGCKVVKPSGCTVKSEGATNVGEITLAANLPSKLAWKGSEGEAAVDILEGVGSEHAFVKLEFSSGCLPLGITKVNVKGDIAAEVEPVAEATQVGELVFPKSPITKYWTGDVPNREEHTISPKLEVEVLGGLAKAPAEFVSRVTAELTNGEYFGVFAA